MLAHAGAWLGLDRLRDDDAPTQSFKVIEAALLPPPAPHPLPPAPPTLVKPAPAPRTPTPPRAEPAPLPIALAAVPIAEPPPALPVAAPPEPAPQPAPVTEPSPAPAPPAPVEAPRFNAAYLNNPPPAYPAAARRLGQEGRVLVRAEVLADGRCSQAELKQGSGHKLLDQAALEAVRKWRFVPARQGDQALAAWVDVPITFKLKN